MWRQRAPWGEGHHLSTQHPGETQAMLGDPGIITSLELKFCYPCLAFTQTYEDMLNSCFPPAFPVRWAIVEVPAHMEKWKVTTLTLLDRKSVV